MRLSDPLELELQPVVSHLMWVLKIKLKFTFSSRALAALNHRVILIAPVVSIQALC